MVKKIFIIIFILLLLTLLGDANPNFIRNHFIYTGESASWSAVYAANEKGVFSENQKGLTFHSWSKDLLTITYKKDPSGLLLIKNIRIDYKPEPESISGFLAEDYTNGPGARSVYRISTGSRGAMLLREDVIFTITVTTNGSAETMHLKNQAVN